MTRAERLLVFVDLPYVQVGEQLYCQDALWVFLEPVLGQFARLALLGRVQAECDAPGYLCPLGERASFHPLPQFSSQYAVAEVARALPSLLRRIWAPVGRCDALLLGIPHPFSLVLWCVARLRRKRVAFLVRQDTQAVVRIRAPARGRRLTLLGTRLLEALFVRLSRTTLTFAVGHAVAARHRAAGGRVQPILVSTVSGAALATRVTRTPSEPRCVRLIWVGRIDQEKRPELMLQGLKALCERRPETLWLDMVGRGPLRASVEALARRLGVAERVRLHGYVPWGPELQRLYRAADVFVHSSASEGFPQVILEAMAAGVPVVSTSAGGIPGSLDHGANAVLVPCDDADALAAGVERVLDDPELAARLRSAGQRFAAEHTLELESQRLLRAWDSHFASDPRQPAPRSK